MGKMDISNAVPPVRGIVGGTDRDRAARFRDLYPPAAKRSVYIRDKILLPNRRPPANPARTEITDVDATTAEIKAMAREMGAAAVGVAEFDRRFVFADVDGLNHKFALVFGIAMSYDNMADIGPRS